MGVRVDNLNLYKKDMYTVEREGRTELPTVSDKVYFVKTAVTGAGDKESLVLGAGPLKRHRSEGEGVDFGSPANGWDFLTNYWTYSSGLVFSMEAVEDTVKLGNLLKDLARTWGRQVRIAQETLCARPFNEGGTTAGDWSFNGTHTGNTDASGDLMYDSINLFAVSGSGFSKKDGTEYYNSVASIGDADPANFRTIYILHTETNAFDERGDRCENMANTVLVKSKADVWDWKRILETPPSQGLPGSQNNDINPYYGEIDNILSWRYLDDAADVFYMFQAGSRAMQLHKRKQPQIRFFRDENNLSFKVSINTRMGLLFRDHAAITRGGGTTT